MQSDYLDTDIQVQPLRRTFHALVVSAVKADSTSRWQENEQGDQEN